MKTDNIYIAMLNVVTERKKGNASGFRLYGIPIYNYMITSKPLKPVLILYKKDKYGGSIIKDLNTKDEYSFQIPSERGSIFVNSESLYPFNSLIDNPKSNLSKRKILKMGNHIINETIKQMKEEKNK